MIDSFTRGMVVEDRKGERWRIVGVDGPKIAPITAARWVGKNYQTRTFQRDGSYYFGKENLQDLVKVCPVESTTGTEDDR